MEGMTLGEKLLTQYLFSTGMEEWKVLRTLKILSTEEELREMLRYIEAHPEAESAELYSTALKISHETNLLEETKK